MNLERAMEGLRELDAIPGIHEHPILGPIFRQLKRLVEAQAKLNYLGTVLDTMGLGAKTAETARLTAGDAAARFEELHSTWLECAGASSALARLYRKLSEEKP